MTRIFGHRWLSNFGESDDGTWLDGLRGLTPTNIAEGYSRMIESGEYDWPPSLTEFRNLCFGIDLEVAYELAKNLVRSRIGSFDFAKLSTQEAEKKISTAIPEVKRGMEQDIITLNHDSRSGYLEDMTHG